MTEHWMNRLTACLVAPLAGLALPLDVEAAEGRATERPPEALQQTWNEMMLAGTFGWMRDGKAGETGTGSFEKAEGWVHKVSMTGHGITIMDLRERRFLKSHGGWVLEGGLLRRLWVGDSSIELYGKTITRHEPYANPLPHVWIGNKSWKLAHEFFLLHRDKLGARATILRTWVVSDPQESGGFPL